MQVPASFFLIFPYLLYWSSKLIPSPLSIRHLRACAELSQNRFVMKLPLMPLCHDRRHRPRRGDRPVIRSRGYLCVRLALSKSTVCATPRYLMKRPWAPALVATHTGLCYSTPRNRSKGSFASVPGGFLYRSRRSESGKLAVTGSSAPATSRPCVHTVLYCRPTAPLSPQSDPD